MNYRVTTKLALILMTKHGPRQPLRCGNMAPGCAPIDVLIAGYGTCLRAYSWTGGSEYVHSTC
jgi:hypothetical protein